MASSQVSQLRQHACINFQLVFQTFLLVAVSCSLTAQESPSQLGSVDYKKIQAAYFRTEIEQASFETMREEKQAELVGPVDEIQDLADAQKMARRVMQDPTLSSAKRQEAADEARKRAEKITELNAQVAKQQQDANAELGAHIALVQADIVTEINAAIKAVAERKKLSAVYNQSFRDSGVPAFPYFAPEVADVTDEVIQLLNQDAPEDWEPESAPGDGEPSEVNTAADAAGDTPDEAGDPEPDDPTGN